MSLRKDGRSKPIPGCLKDTLHMLCFNPSGTILQKVNICSCEDCLEGRFIDCANEKGRYVQGYDMSDDDCDDNDSDSDIEYEMDEFGDKTSENLEL